MLYVMNAQPGEADAMTTELVTAAAAVICAGLL